MLNVEVMLIMIGTLYFKSFKPKTEGREEMGRGVKYDKFMLRGITREAITTL